MASSDSSSSADPVAIICIGMAGSGKTTFMQRVISHLHKKRSPPYVLNLDPAVKSVPFEANIDIRDSVNYKEVMKQYNLGPNGGILTSLNLFSTKVDQIVGILEKRTKPTEPAKDQIPIQHILVDTPGQIEVFVWSASGDILTSSLASTFPTVIAYIIDTPRTSSTSTFMSNMLYACSILYKTKLPMIVVMNKTDVKDASFAKEWMTDFEAFQAALRAEEENGGVPAGFESQSEGVAGLGSGYMGSLLHSMSLVLDEFYKHLSVVGVSSTTGDGVDEFFEEVAEKKAEFEREYKPELERRRNEVEKEKGKLKEQQLGKLMKDMSVSSSGARASSSRSKGKRREPETVSEAEEEDSDQDDDAHGIVDRDEDDEDTVDDMEEDGLAKRYRQALEDREKKKGDGDDFSFAKYIHSANLG